MNLHALSQPRVRLAGDTDCGLQIAECGLMVTTLTDSPSMKV